MNALIHLFIHTLERPNDPTTKSDLALIEFGAGHFARLEYDTNSEYPVPFARRIADLARMAVERATPTTSTIPERSLPGESIGLATESSFSGLADLRQELQMEINQPWSEVGRLPVTIRLDTRNTNLTLQKIPNMNAFDLELENWSALVPILTPPEDLISFWQ